MKKLLIFLILVGYTSLSYSQNLIQTFTDRCTGATQVFQISMTGPTVVVFYNRSQTFTAADVQSGAFQAWLQETYAWWAALNPCSAAQAESTTAQQTAQQTTQAATAAATNAASAAPPPPPDTSSTNTASTSAPPNTDSSASSSSTDSTSSSQSTDSSSSSSGESSQGETSDTGGGGESTEDTGGGESSESKSESTEESKSEESSESEEKVEEEKKEESKEEEKKEEESEEESSEDSEEEKKEEDKKKEKKKNLAPPILAANMMANQMLDGSWTTAASFGISQSSLTGQETYAANAMIWSNLKQFSLGLSKTKLHFWSEYEDISYTYSQKGTRIPAIDSRTGERYVDRQNQIHHVGTTTFNYMNIYGTNVITLGYSRVILGQNDNFWKGFAGGYAATNSIIVLPGSLLISPALTLFGTKPVSFRVLPRWGFAPMAAISLTPLQVNISEGKAESFVNGNFTYILGSGANFKLTQRFVFNLGVNTINNTDPVIPTTFAVTIGARFNF